MRVHFDETGNERPAVPFDGPQILADETPSRANALDPIPVDDQVLVLTGRRSGPVDDGDVAQQ